MPSFLPPAADTDREGHEQQLQAYRDMSGTQRVQIAFRLSAMTRRAAQAGIKSRHPEYDERQVSLALARLLWGDELVRRVWPEQALVDP